MIYFGQRTDVETFLNEDVLNSMIIEMLDTLCTAASFDEFNDKYFQLLPNLILDVCFILIRTTQSERDNMYENPQEFVNLALDTCEGQESKSVKTQAAKLFEALADNINGALTLTTFFSLQFINVTCCAESGK